MFSITFRPTRPVLLAGVIGLSMGLVVAIILNSEKIAVGIVGVIGPTIYKLAESDEATSTDK